MGENVREQRRADERTGVKEEQEYKERLEENNEAAEERTRKRRLKRLKEKERTRKMRKKRKTEKVGGDVSEEEASTDSEEEEEPASKEPSVHQQGVGATLTASSEMERASRVVDDALSSTNQQTENNVTGEGSSKLETKKYLENAKDSESEEAS